VSDPASRPLFELDERPDLGEPVMVVCLEGWIDAGNAAAGAAAAIRADGRARVLASFDTEQLLDHRARRPIMHLVDGVNAGLTWPAIELCSATDRNGVPLLLLTGPEPDHNWRRFVQAVLDLAVEFETRLVVGLGAYPAATPHTRPPHLSATATSSELAAQVGFVNATLDIPAGVQAAIEHACSDVDLPAIGLWAQVPHYAAAMPYPSASASLLDGIRVVTSLDFDKRSLGDEAAEVRERLDELVDRNVDHATHVRRLEEQDDAIRRAVEADLPSGDELAAEVERFLRDQDD
jgi:predicted ATP-grasp superfamily ATP-dependent carboligase